MSEQLGHVPGRFESFDICLKYGDQRAGTFSAIMMEKRCTNLKIEHKSDKLTKTTGNVFVEFQYKGRPSGIATTESDFYGNYIDDYIQP